jgi:hypothetical protein
LSCHEAEGDVSGVAGALGNLAIIHAGRGDLEQALATATDALVRTRAIGDRMRELENLLVLSEIHLRAGRPADAIREADAAGALALSLRNPSRAAAARRQRDKALGDAGRGQLAPLEWDTHRDHMIKWLMEQPWPPDASRTHG